MTSSDIGDNISGLKAISQLISIDRLEVQLKPLVSRLMPAMISLMELNTKAFESLVVLSEEGGADEDHEGGLSTLVLSICEVVNSIIVTDTVYQEIDLIKFVSAMGPYLQIPMVVEEEWIAFPTEFIANEQDDIVSSSSIRMGFEGIVADVLTHPSLSHQGTAVFHRFALNLISQGVAADRGENSEGWRLVEAGLFVLGLVSCDLRVSMIDDSTKETLKLTASLASSNSSRPLLKARALLCLSRLVEITSKIFSDDLSVVLRCASEGLGDSCGAVVYAACCAFNAFLPHSKSNDELIIQVAFRLVDMATSASESEVLHFTIESLIGIVKNRPHQSISERISDFVPDMVRRHVCDPIVPAQLLELIQNSNCSPAMLEQVAAVVRPWLRVDAEIELDVALDFMYEIVKNAPVPFTGMILEAIMVLNEGEIASIGEETNSQVSTILRICAIRQSSP
jgi:hypothetical protein